MKTPPYATADDFAASDWNITPPPANLDRLLATASRMVRRATMTAYYATDTAGSPTDSDVAEAMREATCAQAGTWGLTDIDPAKGGVQLGGKLIASKSLLGGSISYDNGAAGSVTTMQARGTAATELSTDAYLILAEAGLVSASTLNGAY